MRAWCEFELEVWWTIRWYQISVFRTWLHMITKFITDSNTLTHSQNSRCQWTFINSSYSNSLGVGSPSILNSNEAWYLTMNLEGRGKLVWGWACLVIIQAATMSLRVPPSISLPPSATINLRNPRVLMTQDSDKWTITIMVKGAFLSSCLLATSNNNTKCRCSSTFREWVNRTFKWGKLSRWLHNRCSCLQMVCLWWVPIQINTKQWTRTWPLLNIFTNLTLMELLNNINRLDD